MFAFDTKFLIGTCTDCNKKMCIRDSRVDFIQNITKYDKDMLENMVKVREGIEEQEAELKSRQQDLLDLQSQLDSEQAALQAKAEETSTDLATVNAQLEAARAAQKKQEEEAQRLSLIHI